MKYKNKYSDLPADGKVLNGIVTSVSLGMEDHGLLSSFVHIDRADGCSQGFGGWALYLPSSFTHHELKSVAGHFITRVIEVCGVTDWNKVVGKAIRICEQDGRIMAIGHIIYDDWFIPTYDFEM